MFYNGELTCRLFRSKPIPPKFAEAIAVLSAHTFKQHSQPMHLVQTNIPAPQSDADFELMCARIYGKVFNDPLPVLNGRRGQAQGGVDIFVQGPNGRIGIQCKRWVDGSLKLTHIKDEIALAEKAGTSMVRLVVATTAASDAKLVKEVQILSDKRVTEDKFPVDIQAWQDICLHIRSYDELQAAYAPNDPGGGLYRMEQTNTSIHIQVKRIGEMLERELDLPMGRADSLNKFISQQLDNINKLLETCCYVDALNSLQNIGADLGPFDEHQKARWYLQRAICTTHLESGEAAAADFIKAGNLFPSDAKMAAAKIRGLFLQGDVEQAVLLGEETAERFPEAVHVWVALSNARMMKGDVLTLEDAPASMRNKVEVLHLLAWGMKQAGRLPESLSLILQALDAQGVGYFTRAAAMAIALEAVTSDGIKAAFGMFDPVERKAVVRAVSDFDPRRERLWPVQSSQILADTLVHLGFGYILLGRFEDVFALIAEAKYYGHHSARMMRVELEALKRSDKIDEFIVAARRYLPELGEEALVLVAETGASLGDVTLVEATQQAASALTLSDPHISDVLRAFRWGALWQTKDLRAVALEEVRAAQLHETGNLPLLSGGARLLFASGAIDEAEIVIERAKMLVTPASEAADRLLAADLLFATDHLADAASLYKPFAIQGHHSDLHNRLLACYVRTGARRKAKQLICSFPQGWVSDDGARALAMELGQRAGDWAFLEPLAIEQCNQRPDRAASWLFRLVIDLRLGHFVRFQEKLAQLSPTLSGSVQQIAQLATLEMQHGRQQAGLTRLYRQLREKLDDVEAASVMLVSVAARPGLEPYMQETLVTVTAGCSVTLADDFGVSITVTIDPPEAGVLPAKGEFRSATDPKVVPLLGLMVGNTVDIDQSFDTKKTLKVRSVMSAYLRTVRLAHEMLGVSLNPPSFVKLVPVPKDDGSINLTHIHAMLKQQSAHARGAFDAYANNGVFTLGMLSRLLGKNVIDLVTGWPHQGPPVVVCTGEYEERIVALRSLSRSDSRFVIDLTALVELVLLKCQSVLALLPEIFVSTATRESLQEFIQEQSESKASGFLSDVDGVMQMVEVTDSDHAKRLVFLRTILETLDKYCKLVPAYGPDVLPDELGRAEGVLAKEEFAALLLALERDATLITLDARLGRLARLSTNTQTVWPQILMMYALQTGHLDAGDYSYACVNQFLLNRAFVSLGGNDIVMMCMQGGYFLEHGLQRLKTYLSNPATEFESASEVALEFLEIQARLPTQLKAFVELLSHVVEACFRHPDCDRDAFKHGLADLLGRVSAAAVGPAHWYAPINYVAAAKHRVHRELFVEALAEAEKAIEGPARRRAIRLRVLACMKQPYMEYDRTIVDPHVGGPM